MVVRRLLVIPILLAALLPLAGARAQGDIDTVRAVVQQWLLQTLDKPGLILVQYTYEGANWPDDSLGCPVEGETYTPGAVNGYRWTFQFSNQVIYEVHSGLTGTPAVLCSAADNAPEPLLTTYRSPEFSLLAPEAWLALPGHDAVLFAPNVQRDCALPGMRVVLLGRVASGITPDQLIDQYLAALGLQDDPALRSLAGTSGRSTVYQVVCGAGSQAWRVSTFVDYGVAYRIEQWSPAETFTPRWDPLFQEMLAAFAPAGSTPAASAAPSGTETADGGTPVAESIAPPPLPVSHLFAGDVFVGTLDDLPGRGVTNLPADQRRYLAFSPDGLYISFVDTTTGELRVLNAAESLSARKLAEGVDPRFPPSWSMDSQRIAYTALGQPGAEAGTEALDLFAVPVVGGTAERLGTVVYGGDCPLTIEDPADVVYYAEAGPQGRDNVLLWMPDGRFLVSPRCDGGLAMLTPATGEIIDFGADLLGGMAAPDRANFAARTGKGLAILDFAAWQRTNLPVGQSARQIAWGPDGHTLYYSTETPGSSLVFEDEAGRQRGEEVFGLWPVTITPYTLTLVRLDLRTDQETVIWQGQGRAVGRIAPAPDGSGLVFSVIPSAVPLAEVYQSAGDTLAIRQAQPQPALYWLPTDSPTAYLLAYAGQPALAPFTVAAP